jgi:hypothetical protein
VLLEEDQGILMQGEMDAAGRWTCDHDLAMDTIVALVLKDDDGKELIRCRVPLQALHPMECCMRNPPKLSNAQLHKRWRAAYRKQQANGIAQPDPDAVARQAYKY